MGEEENSLYTEVRTHACLAADPLFCISSEIRETYSDGGISKDVGKESIARMC